MVCIASAVYVPHKCAENASGFCCVYMGLNMGEAESCQPFSQSLRWRPRSFSFVYQTDCVAFFFSAGPKRQFFSAQPYKCDLRKRSLNLLWLQVI